MADYGHPLAFGSFLTPSAASPHQAVELAVLCERVGLDIATFQDHPYQPSFHDTWTLISFIAARTSSIRLAANVTNLPLRPPAVLARSLASLDRLSGGRIELGLGAGAFWEATEAMGGERRSPANAVERSKRRWTSSSRCGTPERAAVDLLGDSLLSHLSYEERELVEPLARLGIG